MSSNALRTKVTDLLGLVVREPRTVPELEELTGMTRENIRAWLRLWRDEGLVDEIKSARRAGHGSYVYVWIGAPQ